MAFNGSNLTRVTNVTLPGPQLFIYYTSTDNAATVSANGYFRPFGGSNIEALAPSMNVGDQIYAVCSDANVNLNVTNINPITTAPQTLDVAVGPNSVNTAAIQDDAVTTPKMLDANVTLAKLAAGIAPSHVVKYGAQYTTTGGAAAEAIAIPGVLATDIASCVIKDNGTANVTLLQTACTNNTLTLTFSANPGADTIVYYQIFRAAA